MTVWHRFCCSCLKREDTDNRDIYLNQEDIFTTEIDHKTTTGFSTHYILQYLPFWRVMWLVQCYAVKWIIYTNSYMMILNQWFLSLYTLTLKYLRGQNWILQYVYIFAWMATNMTSMKHTYIKTLWNFYLSLIPSTRVGFMS